MRRARPKQQQQQSSLQQQQQQPKQPHIMITIIIIIIIIKVIIALSADVVTAQIWQPVATAKGRNAATFRRIRELANWQMGALANCRKSEAKDLLSGKTVAIERGFRLSRRKRKSGCNYNLYLQIRILDESSTLIKVGLQLFPHRAL